MLLSVALLYSSVSCTGRENLQQPWDTSKRHHHCTAACRTEQFRFIASCNTKYCTYSVPLRTQNIEPKPGFWASRVTAKFPQPPTCCMRAARGTRCSVITLSAAESSPRSVRRRTNLASLAQACHRRIDRRGRVQPHHLSWPREGPRSRLCPTAREIDPGSLSHADVGWLRAPPVLSSIRAHASYISQLSHIRVVFVEKVIPNTPSQNLISYQSSAESLLSSHDNVLHSWYTRASPSGLHTAFARLCHTASAQHPTYNQPPSYRLISLLGFLQSNRPVLDYSACHRT